jgi:hypothetical protein
MAAFEVSAALMATNPQWIDGLPRVEGAAAGRLDKR